MTTMSFRKIALALLLVTTATAAECEPKKGMCHFEKGIKCNGKFETGKGGIKRCQGSVKSKFHAEATADCVAHEIAEGLREQLPEAVIPDTDDMLPPDDIMQAMQSFDETEMVGDYEEGFSKTFEFGGTAKLEWGCKVIFSKEDGEFQKNVECGFTGKKKMGMAGDSSEDMVAMY